MVESRDVVVVGGGPAGSTFAAIAAKYDPSARITVLEREHHPRYHIGESLIPVANGVFHDLELFDTLYDGRFVKKLGITFVWGRDRTPWDADYLEIETIQRDDGTQILDVVGQDFTSLLRRELRRDQPFTAINVRRAEFDKLLIDQARHFGAEVREGTEAVKLHTDDAGRVTGVSWRDDTGAQGRIDAPLVIDASGLAAFGGRGEREYCPDLANFAVSGYFRGADWKIVFRGHAHEATNVFIASVEHGWLWYIPVGPDLVSCGAVTSTRHFKDRLKHVDLEAFFWEMVRSCPEIAPLVAQAELVDDMLPGGKRVQATRDWSGWAKTPVRPGYVAVGDSAIFVDPILSSGLTMAVQSGHRAAYTFNTLRKRPELDAAELWGAYADYVRGEAGSYLTLARYYYGNNKAADSWWWQAQRQVNPAGQLRLDDREAFTLATAGFFPTPRAISVEIMAPLLEGLLGTDADLKNIYHATGVPQGTDLERARITVRTPFSLKLRGEPEEHSNPDGLLNVFHDLVADDFDFAHRNAAVPCRIAPALAPIVAALPRFATVAELLEAAPDLIPGGHGRADEVRQSTLAILRNAAKKGFIALEGPP